MSLSPFSKGLQISVSDLKDEMNRMLDRFWHAGISTAPLDGQKWAPSIDVIDESTQYLLVAEVPGLNVEDIEVCYEHGELILKGHKAVERDEDEDVDYLCLERRFGNFCRRVPMPEPINADGIRASCQKGLLEVVLPKKEPPDRKTVTISVREG